MNKCSGKFPVAPVAGCSRASFFAAIFTGELASRGAGNSWQPTFLRLIKTITIRSGCIGEEDLGQDSRLRTLRQCISVLVVEIKRKKYSLFRTLDHTGLRGSTGKKGSDPFLPLRRLRHQF